MTTVYYTKDHEYLRVEGDVATVGVTDFAQSQLGDIVFIELPEKGRSFAKGEGFATIESVKAASEVFAPVSGEVVDANAALEEAPAKVNEDPEGDGWFVKLKLSDKAELADLLDAAGYDAHVKTA